MQTKLIDMQIGYKITSKIIAIMTLLPLDEKPKVSSLGISKVYCISAVSNDIFVGKCLCFNLSIDNLRSTGSGQNGQI